MKAKKRDGQVLDFIITEYDKFVQSNGSALAEFLSSLYNNDVDALEVDENVDDGIDLDDDNIFGDIL